MNCPTCGAENLEPKATCRACGRPLTGTPSISHQLASDMGELARETGRIASGAVEDARRALAPVRAAARPVIEDLRHAASPVVSRVRPALDEVGAVTERVARKTGAKAVAAAQKLGPTLDRVGAKAEKVARKTDQTARAAASRVRRKLRPRS
jgi:hypothetical protein